MAQWMEDVVTVDDYSDPAQLNGYTHVGPGSMADWSISGGALHGAGSQGSALQRNAPAYTNFRLSCPANATQQQLMPMSDDGHGLLYVSPKSGDFHLYSTTNSGGGWTDLGSWGITNQAGIASIQIEKTGTKIYLRTYDAGAVLIQEVVVNTPAGFDGPAYKPGVRIYNPADYDSLRFASMIPAPISAVTHTHVGSALDGPRTAVTKAQKCGERVYYRRVRARMAGAIRGWTPPMYGQIWPRGRNQ